MKKEVMAYCTALYNSFDRMQGMISTEEVKDYIEDLIDFVSDLEEDIPFAYYDPEGSDGMDELNIKYPLN